MNDITKTELERRWKYRPEDNAIVTQPDESVNYEVKLTRNTNGFDPKINEHITDCHNALLVLPKLQKACQDLPEDAIEEVAEIGNVLKLREDCSYLLNALQRISRLTANPLTEGGCKTRADFIRLNDKVREVANDTLRNTEETE